MAEVRPDPAPRCDDPRGFGAPLAHLGEWEGGRPVHRVPPIEPLPAASLDWTNEELAHAAVDVIRIDRWTEAMGSLEGCLLGCARVQDEGALLLMDLHHALARSRVKESLEGRSTGLHPRSAPAEREISFAIPRLAWALSDHGYVLEDLAQVQAGDPDSPRSVLESLFRAGYSPTRRLYGMPGERLWLRARRTRVLAGSVLLTSAPGQEQALETSRRAIESWLPGSWELCIAPPLDDEMDSWNEAVTRSRGESLFFVRAGDTPSRETFESLCMEVPYHPVRAAEGQRSTGLSGLMVDRPTVFEVGPLPREFDSSLVAGEEWMLRANSCGYPVAEVGVGSDREFVEAPGHASDASEAPLLQERWAFAREFEGSGSSELREVPPAPWKVEGREPILSLCMIARNEEENLPRCLERVRDHVDEIVLVDTGSTDRTVEIAEGFGARVLHRAWDQDFSAPRNLALDEAKGDWILVLDADEVVDEASLVHLRDLLRVECACGYHIRFVNDHESARSNGITMVRLFRKLPGIRYEKAIHEQVIPTLMREAARQDLLLLKSRLEVVHYGYSDEQMQTKGKIERNTALFEKQLEREPDDIYTLYKYGDFLRQIEAPAADIISIFDRALSIMLREPPSRIREMPYASEVCALLALEHAKQGDHVRGDRVARIGLSRFMPTPNLHYIAAGLALHLGRYEEALAQYRSCLGFRGKSLVIPIQEGCDSWIAFAGMGECWFKKGDWDRAEELFRRAVRLAPHWEVGIMRLSSFLLGTDRTDEALDLLRHHLATQGEQGAVRYQGALILEHVQAYGEAASWYELALASPEAPGSVCAQQAGACHLLDGQPARAREAWKRLGNDEVAQAGLVLVDRIEGRSGAAIPRLAPRARNALERMKNFLERTGRPEWASHAGDLLRSPIEGEPGDPPVSLGSHPDPQLARK